MSRADVRILLHRAVEEENCEVVEFLIRSGFPVNTRALNKDLAVEFKTDVEHRLEGVNLYRKSCTPLHLAARLKDKTILEYLLANDVLVDARMEGGETPLIIAVAHKRLESTKLLLKFGADPDSRTLWGKTALHYAAQIGDVSLVELLLNFEADLDVVTKNENMTPLHIAVEAGYVSVVHALVNSGADLGLRTKRGATAVHFAAVMGHEEILELLVIAGADINDVWNCGKLDLAPFDPWVSPKKKAEVRDLVSKYVPKIIFTEPSCEVRLSDCLIIKQERCRKFFANVTI